MEIKNILITGITGYTGSQLAKKALGKGYNVSGIYRKPLNDEYIKDIKNKISLFKYDETYESLNKIFQSNKIDAIFHIAAISSYNIKPEKIGDLIDSNIKFGTQLLEAMTNNNCFNLINTGSYWQNSTEANYSPNSLYAVTKESFQNIIDYYCIDRNLASVTLKPYDIYGPNDNRPKIFNLIKKCHEERKSLDMTKGEQKINLIHIDDLTNAYLHALTLLEKGKHKKYFVGSNELYSLRETIEKFIEINNYKVNINWGKKEYNKNQIMIPFIGESMPGWKAKVKLEEGLKNI